MESSSGPPQKLCYATVKNYAFHDTMQHIKL